MRKSLRESFVLFLFLQLFIGASVAQTIAIRVPYQMSFEESDSVELQQWVLNPGTKASQCAEQWVVGDACASDGKRALYISLDGGVTDHFGVHKNTQYVYRKMILPKGSYNLTFDWRCMGGEHTAFYAGVGAFSALDSYLRANNKSAVVNDYVVSASGKPAGYDDGRFYGTSTWKNTTFTFNSNGTRELCLYFAWTNANTDSMIVTPISACIDNIQITPVSCAQPTSLTASATCDSLVLQWEGYSEKYDVEYRRRGSKQWRVYTNIYQSDTSEKNTLILEGLQEGAYDFRVRGVCNDTVYSAYKYLNSFVVFCPENHCINYVNLYDSTNVICTYGIYGGPGSADMAYLANPEVGVIDYGPNSIDSRHTVIWEPDMWDERTGNQLPLIPDGEYASVRVGNWKNGGEAESVEYLYTVDAETAAILLVRYAVVLEDPGHGGNAEPQFKLEILDENGIMIDPTCGVADFTFSQGIESGWQTSNWKGKLIAWKPWTTIGLNLEAYDGETLIIRLTSLDCGLGGHFAYAYFTLGCAAARIYGTSCGNEAQMSIAAPDGFEYAWYNKYDSIVATTQQLSVTPDDTTTYRCHLSYKEEASCGFDLYSAAYPRFPIADLEYTYAPKDCRNVVRFTNKSHIFTMFNNVPEHHYDDPCDAYEWTFSGENLAVPIQSADEHPVVVFPNEGGTYTVTLFASIAEGVCVKDTTMTFTIPAIGDTDERRDTTICEGSYFTFDKYVIAEAGEFVATQKSVAGCDSTVTMHVTVLPQHSIHLGDTTVCAEDPLCIDGECYKLHESGKWVRFYINQYGCDSTVQMNVTMMDSILPTVDVQDVGDEVHSGAIVIGGTGYDYYTLNGEKNAPLTGLDGGIYEMSFFNDFGCSRDTTFLLNFSCLKVQFDSLSFACADDDMWVLPFVVDSGIVYTYSLLYDSVAHAQGFVDIVDAPMPTDAFQIAIADGAQPGIYHAQLVLHDVLCEAMVVDLTLPLHFSRDLIFQRWDDVLSVKNAQHNGGFEFVAFQWYKNGEAIAGATKSYYTETGGLDVEAAYTCKVTLPEGYSLITCDFVPKAYAAGVSVQPTQAQSGSAVHIIAPQGGEVTCYSATGLFVSSATLAAGTNTFAVPAMQGVYVLQVTTTEGVETFRITVE